MCSLETIQPFHEVLVLEYLRLLKGEYEMSIIKYKLIYAHMHIFCTPTHLANNSHFFRRRT